MNPRHNQRHDWWQRLRMAVDELATKTRRQAGTRSSSTVPHRGLVLSDLEPRVLFSATPIDPAVLNGGDETATVLEIEIEAPSSEESQADEAASTQTIAEPATSQAREIIVIDAGVPGLQELLDDLQNSQSDADVYVLDADRDGVDQISEILKGRTDVSSVHIVSHAEDSAVRLGNVWLGENNLDGYAGQIASWQSSLSSDADILLYGCDLAEADSGQLLLDSISVLTGADVAASTDDTGHAVYNADWDLEYATGSIETQIAFSTELQENWLSKLATISVTTFADEDNGTGLVSLREAINNATAGDTIDLTFLGDGTYTITIGSLEIDKNLTIVGIGARSTVIDATGLGNRVFHLQDTSVVNMSGMTIQGGDESNGGGIYVADDSTLNLSDALLQNNSSNDGGAIHVHGTAHLSRVLLYNNTASGKGGAINFHGANGGSLTNVTISGNTSSNQGGGLFTDSDISITNSTITQNIGTDGGGIRNNGGVVTITNTIVAGNSAGGTNDDVLGAIQSQGFNLIEVVGAATGFVESDITGVGAGLDALADNGGSTDTHALMSGSAALNAGGNFGVPTTDQTGADRDSIPDIGAFESIHLTTKIYWSEQGTNSVYRSNGDGTAVQRIATGLGSPRGLEIDLAGGKLYWIETATSSLHSSNLDGSGASALNTTDLVNPTGLGIDLVNGHLYVADDGGGADDAIRRFNLDGSGFTTLVDNLDGIIGDVAIDAVSNTAYFTYHNGGSFDGKIKSVSLAGGAISDLISSLTGPTSLAIDQPAGRLYFTDNSSLDSLDRVRGVDLSDGGNSQAIASSGLRDPLGVAVVSATGKVYWGDAGNDFIRRSNVDGSQTEPILTSLSSPQEIVAVTLGNFLPTADASVYSIEEGAQLDLDASASSDLDGAIVSYEWDLNDDGDFSDLVTASSLATVSWNDLSNNWGINDGDLNGTAYTIRLRVTDDLGSQSTASTSVTVANVAPTISATGSASVLAGTAYTLNLSATDLGDETIDHWTINWGDGNVQEVAGNSSSVTHTYAVGGLSHSITVSVTDEDGTWFENDLIVTSSQTGSVFRFDGLDGVTGQFSQEFGTNDVNSPGSAILGPDGLLYVGGFGSSDIERYNPTTGVRVDTFISTGSNGLSQVGGLAFGPDGDLYVASYGNDRIIRYDGTDGSFVENFITTNIDGPIGLVFHSDGDLYVASYNNDKVVRFNGTTGQFIEDFVTTGQNGLDGPEFIAFDADGDLYVASYENDRVLRYNSDGSFDREFVTFQSGGLDGPIGLTFGPDGHLYVGSENTDQVLRYDGSTGAFLGVAASGNGLNGARDPLFLPNIQVSVTSPNLAPTDLAITPASVNENIDTTGGYVIGTLSTTDPDAGETFGYQIIGGTDQGLFAINVSDQLVLDHGILDFESKDSYEVRVRVTDSATNVYEETLTIGVNDLNEAPSVSLTPIVLNLDENTNTGTATDVATINLTDDALGSESFYLTGDDAGLFEIVGGKLRLIAGASLDFESNPSLDVTVNVDDDTIGLDPDDTATYSITINDVNDVTPIVDAGQSFSIREDAANTTSLGFVTATDPDTVGALTTWTITGGNTGGVFEIDSSTGELRVLSNTNLDQETTPTYSLSIRVQDGTNTSTNQTVNVNVVDVAEVNALWFSTSEDVTASGNPDLGAWDEDQILQYGGAGLNFEPSGGTTTGTLSTAGFKASNFGAAANVRVEAMHYVWSDLTVGTGGNTFALKEGDILLSFDQDNVTLTSDSEAAKTFNKNDVFVFRAVTIGDYSQGDFFHLLDDPLTAGQIRGVSLIENEAGVTVGDTTLAQGTFLLVRDGVDEQDRIYTYNATGVGELSTSGTDQILLEGDDTASGGNLAMTGRFDGIHLVASTRTIGSTVVQEGDLLVSTYQASTIAGTAVEDHDISRLRMTTTRVEDTHSTGLAVVFFDASDEAMAPGDTAEDIDSLTLVEGASASNPVGPISDTDANANEVAENTGVNSTVGITARAVDPNAGSTITYSLDNSAGNLFTIDSGGVVRVNGTLNYENATSHDIIVRATSNDTSFQTIGFTISILDVNDNAPVVADSQAFSVSESAADTTSVGFVSASDADTVGTLTNWQITSGNDDGVFAISNSGELTIADRTDLDFETIQDYTLGIRVGDGLNTSNEQTITVNVTNENDAPEVSLDAVVTNLAENANTGTPTVVATINVTDDALGSETLYLSGADAAMFEIDGTDLRLIANASLDYETNPSLDVTVNVNDTAIAGDPEDSATYTITIGDINEAPSLTLTSVVATLPENTDTSSSIKVANLSVNDDALGTNTVLLIGDDAALFELRAGNTELHLIAGALLNADLNSALDVTITVNDPAVGGTPDDVVSHSVAVTDINTPATVTVTQTLANILENADTTTSRKVADVEITDDSTGTNSLILSGADAGLFELQLGNTELHLKAGVTLDFETNASLDVTVGVDDPSIPGSPEDADSISVAVQDANDAATGVPVINGTVTVGSTLTADVSGVQDEDGLGAFSYQWFRGGTIITGANADSYTVTAADEGRQIRVAVTFNDTSGNPEGPLVSSPVAIAMINHAPTLENFSGTMFAGQKLVVAPEFFQRQSNDVDGDPLTAVLVAAPGNGTFSLQPNGQITYTPDPDFTGEVVLYWKANDGELDSNVATVTVTVLAPPGTGKPVEPPAPETERSPTETSEEGEGTSSDDENTETESDTPETNPVPTGHNKHGQSESASASSSDLVKETQVTVAAETAGETTLVDAAMVDGGTGDSASANQSNSNAASTETESVGISLNADAAQAISAVDYALMTRPGLLWDQLDNYQNNVESRIQGDLIVVGTAGAAASSVTAGVVAWALRSGFLLSGLIAHMPAWSGVDPLLIMQGLSGDAAGGETLEEMMNRHDQNIGDEETTDA